MNNPLAKRVASRYMEAAITHPPRQPMTFLKSLRKKLKDGFDLLLKLEPTILGSGSEDDWDAYGDTDIREPDYGDMEYFFRKVRQFQKDELRSIQDNIQFIFSEDSGYFQVKGVNYLINSLGYLEQNLESLTRISQVIQASYKRWALPEWVTQERSLHNQRVIGIYKTLPQIPPIVNALEKGVITAQAKLTELLRVQKDQDDVRPQHEKKETLYHTSVNARKLYSSGFSDKVPTLGGIGGSQNTESGTPGISFTSDLYVAKEIMRSLKEAIMIAKGQVQTRHILEWADKEGIKDKILASFAQLYGNKNMDQPQWVMSLYSTYLWLSNKRYNPVYVVNFATMMRDFKSLSPRNVGVLVCTVDMAAPEIKYLSSMHEYRVPPYAVLSIDKVIS